MKIIALAFVFVTVVLAACTKEKAEKQREAVVFFANDDITAKPNEFRDQLGVLNTTTDQVSGRREINWDGVPDSMLSKKLPDDFFNQTTPGAPASLRRGLMYAGNTGEFQISDNKFASLNVNAAGEFTSFSGNKIFSNTTANRWPVTFRVAGKTEHAFIKGFGAVFIDVDLANSTSVEFFDNNNSVGKFFVPPHTANSSFSFLGVYFPGDERITTVEVKHDGILADGQKDISAGGPKDLAGFDDFIYSEPVEQ